MDFWLWGNFQLFQLLIQFWFHGQQLIVDAHTLQFVKRLETEHSIRDKKVLIRHTL